MYRNWGWWHLIAKRIASNKQITFKNIRGKQIYTRQSH